MPLNNYFSLKRFVLLLKQDLLINRTRYLLGLVILGLVVYICSYLQLMSNQKNILLYAIDSKQNEMYKYYNVVRIYSEIFNYYLFAMAIIIGTAFPDLSDKIKTSKFLLNPGSTFEKFLVQFLIRVGYFLPLSLGIFWIAIRLAKLSLTPDAEGIMTGVGPAIIPYFHFKDLFTDHWENKVWLTKKILFVCIGFITCTSWLLAGSTFFRGFALIKTVISAAIVFGIAFLYCAMLNYIFILAKDQNEHFYSINNMMDELILYSYEFAFLLVTLCIPCFLLLFCTYFNLKEKEI